MTALPRKVKKKDFDKEKMYAKIMPSIAPAERPVEVPQEKPSPEAAASAAAPDPAGEELAGPGLHNYMEDMVRDRLEHTMKVLSACDCPRCRQDIMALALNQLPSSYAVAGDGDEARYLKKLRGAYEVKVTASLIKAIQQVKTNPRHK